MGRFGRVWSVLIIGLWSFLVLFSANMFAAPPQGQDSIYEALRYIDSDQLPKALESVKKAMATNPDLVEAHLLYIRLMTDLGKRAEVEAEYARRKDQKKDGLSTLLYGRTLADAAKMEAQFRKALELDPRLGWAYYCQASLHVQKNDPAKAIEALQSAIRVQPEFPQALQSLVSLYLAQDKQAEALKVYEQLAKYRPEDVQILYEYGSLLGKKGDYAQAAAYLAKADKLSPDSAQIQTNLAFVYLKLKRYDESIGLYDKVLVYDPNNSSARLNREVARRVRQGGLKFESVELMEKAMDAQTPQQAISTYRKVIELNPDFELAYMAMGQLLAATGKPEDAEKAFSHAVKLSPSSVEANRILAEFYIVGGQPQKAEPILTKAIALSPKSPELYAVLGLVRLEMGKATDAEKDFTKSIQLLSEIDAIPVRINRARAIAVQGRLPEAIVEFQSVLKQYPKHNQARVELASCYVARDELDNAMKELTTALQYEPKHKEIKALLQEVQKRDAENKTKAKDQYRARQIVLKEKAVADQVLKELSAGADFDTLARQRSISPDAALGGDVGFFKKGELLPEFERAVLALKVGETSGVVSTSKGFHIIRRLN